MVARGKPAPDLFLHASAEMGYEPSGCIVVEDSPAGIEAAKAAGMRVFAFVGASHARNERHRRALASLNPDALFDDMGELIQFVRQ
jgi:beta-phosphoglucomutase-like phosphatase (HAD superfamily)